MKTRILLFFTFVFFISCDQSSIYSEFNHIGENNRWTQSDSKAYEFVVEDDAVLYDVKFHFSHVYDYPFASVPIHFSITNPNGEKEDFTIDLAVKNNKGAQLADCSGAICDLIQIIKEKVHLQKGTYNITVTHSFKGFYLPNVIGVGLEVDRAR